MTQAEETEFLLLKTRFLSQLSGVKVLGIGKFLSALPTVSQTYGDSIYPYDRRGTERAIPIRPIPPIRSWWRHRCIPLRSGDIPPVSDNPHHTGAVGREM
jgi:hypothetical protein